MLDEIKIDLRGLDIDELEAQKILEAARLTLIQVLTEKAHPQTNAVVALGPGWIGIEAYAENLPE